jgi:Holliday junction resolvase-like predicted endonuclease
LAHRLRTPLGEVDLVFYSPPNTLRIVEVKSSSREEFQAVRLKFDQRRRLMRIHRYFQSFHTEVELNLVLVDDQNKVQVFEDIW